MWRNLSKFSDDVIWEGITRNSAAMSTETGVYAEQEARHAYYDYTSEWLRRYPPVEQVIVPGGLLDTNADEEGTHAA